MKRQVILFIYEVIFLLCFFLLSFNRFWRCNQCCTLDTPDGSLDGGSIEKPSTLDASSNDSENDPWSDPWEMPGDDPEQEEEQELEEETSSQPSSVDYANLSRTESSFFIKDKDSPPKIFAQTMPSTMSPPSANVKTSPYQSARTSSPSRIPRLSLPTADTRQPSPTRNTRTSPRTTSPTRNSQQSSPIGSHPSSPHSKSKTLPSAGSSMTPLRRISLSEAARPRNSGKSNSRFLLPDPESAPYSGSTWMFKSKTPRAPKARPQSVGQSRVPTKHDQTAALMGLLSASGLTMDMLMAMDEETQRETLIAAATIRNSSRLTDTERLQLRNGQAIAEEDELASSRVRFSLPVSPVKEGEETKEEITPPKQPFDHKDALKKLQRRSAEELENKMISETEAADSKKPAPRVKSTRKVPSVRVEQPPNKLERLSSMKLDHPPRAERMSSVRFEQSPVKADPVRRVHHEPVHVPTKVQVQAPATVSQESVDPRKAMMMMLAKRGGSEPAAEVTTIEASEPAVDPRKAMMMMLAKKAGGGDGEVSAPPPKDPRNAMMAMLAKRGGGGDAEPSTETKAASTASGGGGNVTVQLKDCRKYGKYFKMLKVTFKDCPFKSTAAAVT